MNLSRRYVLALTASPFLGRPAKARIAFTMDLEMSRNFPTWDQTHWDYEKGNLDGDTKRYAVGAARRIRDAGAHMHFFVVGRVFEQEDIGWLREIVAAGHPVGNHTYDHVYLLAKTRDEIQTRFARAPWLIGDKPIAEVLLENIRMTTSAMRERLGIAPAGFRTPGGFTTGLRGREDLQLMLKRLGFNWVSSLYPHHLLQSNADGIANIVRASRDAQPFRYSETGMLEIPISPISDIGAFRNGKWGLDDFLRATRATIEQTIESGGVLDILCHPSCIGVVDPNYRTVETICNLVREAADRAELVTLDRIAEDMESRQ
jgi:peptidoglycan/xylan/chitin deacetylase (PgdA/CDA1 family)